MSSWPRMWYSISGKCIRTAGKPLKSAPAGARKSYPMNSMELNRELGGAILEACPDMKVDVHHPDIWLTVEVRQKKIYIYSREIPGPGGMPVGTNGSAMLAFIRRH